jgi:hypothetical protein
MQIYVDLIMLAAYFLSFPQIASIPSILYGNCSLIKGEWLAAGIALRVVGAVLAVSSGDDVKFAQSSSQ